jgi:hypothetical protein
MSLKDQIADARKQVRKLMKVAPYLFPEWQRLQNARRRVDEAAQELIVARSEWKDKLK